MRINYNVSAMIANNNLSNNDNLLARSLQRLSSGLKINAAKDNPAGLAMAKRMNAQIRGLDMASQNASDGTSVIETAEGALSEVADMLQRMTELSVQAANGVMTDEDRQVIQDEIAQLKQEVTRISKTTEFNGQPLLDGTYDLRAFTDQNDYKVYSYSPEVGAGDYTNLSLSWTQDADGKMQVQVDGLGPEFPGTPADYSTSSMLDDIITLSGPEGFEMKIQVPESEMTGGSISNLNITATGIGPMRLQIGSNEGQILELDIPAVSLSNLGIKEMDVSTQDGAKDALDRLKEATTFLNSVRGRLGAYQNRLETTVNSLDITSENMTSAYSRIMDVDMAEEMTAYSTYTVLTQAGTSVLAQANERPSSVLQLLQ